MNSTTFVGLDVHKDSIAVAVARPGRQEPEQLGVIPNTPEAVARMMRKLGRPEKLSVCYEAGPCGYEIYRQLTRMGISCVVVAPSLIPRRPGERIKTDRRDARKLARLLRIGELTPVRAPGEDQEAMRDLVRARKSAKEDVLRKRNELSKFLLRLGLHPAKGVNPWTQKHRQWLESLRLEQAPQQVVLRDYLHALDEALARLQRLEKEIGELAPQCCDPEMLQALQALRGVQLVTSVTIVTELWNMEYFRSPAQLMSFVGLVPSEHSSGGKERRGSITKAGNAHVRRVVVEAAWHYRHIPRVGVALKKRQEGVPEEVKAIAWKAQNRLNKKYRRMVGRGKLRTVTVVAMARELMGFIWAIAQEVARKKQEKQAS